MPTPTQPTASTSFINAESALEIARLSLQDRMVTNGMGGILPEQPGYVELALRDVLDIGCGPGGWVLDVAFSLPWVNALGIDLSPAMVSYARGVARAQDFPNAAFQVMDACQTLGFADESFDLVNVRFATGFLLRQDWPRLLRQSWRVLRPGGIMRLTEGELSRTSSPALGKLQTLLARALWRAGHTFSSDGQALGVTLLLDQFLGEAGYQERHTQAFTVDCSAGADAHANAFQNAVIAFQLLQRFVLAMEVTTQDEVGYLCQKAQEEMLADDFLAYWNLLTAWGQKR